MNTLDPDSKKLIIGLTGSFASGCSTVADILKDYFEFDSFKLSYEIRIEAEKTKEDTEKRSNLQNIGDDLRLKNKTEYLAIKAFERASESSKNRIVFDGIRNLGEVIEFKKRYPNFYLIAVDCTKDLRWERLEKKYQNKDLFELDDNRDKDGGFPHGQQVLRCVEAADIIISNNDNNIYQSIKRLKGEIGTYINLITGEIPFNPPRNMTMMAVASTLALQSNCIKRRVGAVLCDKDGYLISAACNEVPLNQNPCHIKYEKCYRDYYKMNLLNDLIKNIIYCPYCANRLSLVVNSLKCNNCGEDISNIFPKYKMLAKCRALHAEETAILNTPNYKLEGSILYSTTFPCLQCTKIIIKSGIKRIYYIDPYPDEEALRMINDADIYTIKYEGVKAQAYYKLFYKVRESLESRIK